VGIGASRAQDLARSGPAGDDGDVDDAREPPGDRQEREPRSAGDGHGDPLVGSHEEGRAEQHRDRADDPERAGRGEPPRRRAVGAAEAEGSVSAPDETSNAGIED